MKTVANFAQLTDRYWPNAPRRFKQDSDWAAPGFVDTEIGVTLDLEDGDGTEKDVHAGVQA